MLKLQLSSKTPKTRGQEQGEALRKQIQELASIRRELVLGFLKGFDVVRIEELALLQARALVRYPHYYEEFLGIAEGAKIAVSDLVILNNYTDMRDFSHSAFMKQPVTAPLDDGGCSVLSARNKPTLSFAGQTWDMHASARPYMLHLSIPQDAVAKTPRMELLTLSGCFALSGVNEHGVAVFINNMHCEETSVSLLWPCLVRGMLSQNSAASALDYLKKNIPCSGHNYLICDGTSFFNVETTGLRFEVTANVQDNGFTFHTNHYVGSLVSTEILDRRSKTSLDRHTALQTYFKNKALNSLKSETLVDDLFASDNQSAICIKPPKDPHGSATCGGIFYDWLTKSGCIFGGLYSEKEHSIYRI